MYKMYEKHFREEKSYNRSVWKQFSILNVRGVRARNF